MMDRIQRLISGYLPEAVPLPMLTGILITSVLLVIMVLSGWLWWRYRQRNRFIYRFSILWDKNHQPFCPTCRSPLGNLSPRSSWKFEPRKGRTVRRPTTYYAFDCPICTKPVRLVDHDGYEVALEQALAQLQPPNSLD